LSSDHRLLPPSMIVSPASISSPSLLTVSVVGWPAGTMTQTARGASSFETSSSSDDAPLAPCDSASLTASSEKSNATHWWSESRWIL
jgi:hypothetical protein